MAAIYECKQNGMLVNEYFTSMTVIWEDLEALNGLPSFTTYNKEIEAFHKDFKQQKEEQKLFQFLNGLDDEYASQRSQLLMMTPLPTAETACSCVQTKEHQRDILKHVKTESDSTDISNDGELCTACGKTSHSVERCW